jgi:hypothetical protein
VIASDGAEQLKAVSVTGSGAGIQLFGTHVMQVIHGWSFEKLYCIVYIIQIQQADKRL